MKKVKPKFQLVTLDLPPGLLKRIKEIAIHLDVSVEDLIKSWLYLRFRLLSHRGVESAYI